MGFKVAKQSHQQLMKNGAKEHESPLCWKTSSKCLVCCCGEQLKRAKCCRLWVSLFSFLTRFISQMKEVQNRSWLVVDWDEETFYTHKNIPSSARRDFFRGGWTPGCATANGKGWSENGNYSPPGQFVFKKHLMGGRNGRDVWFSRSRANGTK